MGGAGAEGSSSRNLKVIWGILKKWRFVILGVLALVLFLTIVDPLLERILDSYRDKKAPVVQTIPHWQRFTKNEYGYVVEFPSRPFENPSTLSNRQNVVSYRQFASVLGSNQVFMVATLVTSLTNTYTDEQIHFLLDVTMKRAIGADGKLLAQRDIMLGANIGREFEFQKPDGYFTKMRLYQVGHNLQELIVRIPLADEGSTNISRFLDSFSLISK